MCIFSWTASASCQDIRFSDGSRFCFDIKKVDSKTFDAQVSSKSTSSSISCTLTLPNNRTVTLSNCEWRFTYDGNDVWGIHLRATWRTSYDLLANYDFRNWTFDWSYSSSSSSYYNDYYPEFTSISNSRPSRDQWVDVTLKVKRSSSSYDYYDWRVDFYVERYNWGSWSRASSYEYDLDKSTYTFSRSDWWEKRFYSFVRFRESWEYRLVAELRDNGEKTYETFNVDGYYSDNSSSSSSYSAREISVYSISPSNPSTYEWVDVSIRAIASNWNIASNYNKRVKIEVQQYTNGSWKTASFSDYDLSQESYTFSTSDDWRKTFNSLVRFRRTWEYRLKFTEEYDSSVYGTKTINVDTTSSNDNSYYSSSSYNAKELSVYSVSSSNPSTYQWINVTLRAIASNGSVASNYNKRVRIEVQEYRNGSWRSANSSDYDLDKTSYTFSTSDNWIKTFNSLVRFRTSWEFRLMFTEDNDSSVYWSRTINVGWSSSSSSYSSSYNAKELYVYSVSSSNPSTYQWINVTLRAIASNWSIASNYNKRVRIEVQEYRNGSWRSASSSDYDLDRSTYTFSTSDNWVKTFSSLVRFRTNWEFRLKFTEDNDSSVYGTKTINVGWSSSSSSYSSSYNAKELYVYSVSSSNPSTYQWINVTLRAIASNWSIASNYNKRVRIEVQEYRNGSWRSASSSDYDLDRSTYTFSTSDNWVKTFSSLVRFRTNWEFRLKFTEDNDSSVYGTKTINVGGYSSSSSYYYDDYYYNRSSSYYGNFTDSELKKIRAIYDIWDNVISSLERDYPNLRNSSSWRSRSDTFKRDMKDILTDSRSSSFRNWSDFYEWFMDWLSYTTRTR